MNKFLYHLRKHIPLQPFRCRLCGRDFTSPLQLYEHVRKRHVAEMMKLPIPEKSSRGWNHLCADLEDLIETTDDHNKQAKPTFDQVCRNWICRQTFPTSAALAEHSSKCRIETRIETVQLNKTGGRAAVSLKSLIGKRLEKGLGLQSADEFLRFLVEQALFACAGHKPRASPSKVLLYMLLSGELEDILARHGIFLKEKEFSYDRFFV